jgi:Plant specific eukaryotic initiation factor 4B
LYICELEISSQFGLKYRSFFSFSHLVHFFISRPETAEEKSLKEEISSLKAELTETEQKDLEEAKELQKRIFLMENDLERLILELDNKVRFGQRSSADTRPGSGPGRVQVHPQPGASEEPRTVEDVERPYSGGSSRGDSWSRPVEENKWGFQGPHNRGSFGGISDSR